MSVKLRLGLMMFLQYAIWGSWAPVLSEYLINNLGFSGTQVGLIYSLLPLATIIAPFIGGQIADRYFPTQNIIAVLQLSGGALLVFVSAVTNWRAVFMVPTALTLICAAAFIFLFKENRKNMKTNEMRGVS